MSKGQQTSGNRAGRHIREIDMAGPVVARTVPELRSHVASWTKAGETAALVPTMGALHDGHLALVKMGQNVARRTIVSIFVNPTQFAPTEDFDKYPRTWDEDIAKLTAVGADLVWAPTASAMYPAGFATYVTPEGAAQHLETDFRPHFFRGVATVCCKLFTQTGAQFAIFGEKDFQQLCVVRQMARDLDLPISIIGHATVRESDGLAMSSRNRYLSPAERQQALAMPHVLERVSVAAARGSALAGALAAGKKMLSDAGFGTIDYLVVRDAETLEPFDPASGRPGRVLAAAWLGKTRLIDNMAVSAHP
jgi:pantoate--beta-alanine ligase